MTATTPDKFLGGRLLLKQPVRGFRSGLDAVMLAAAVPARGEESILELGCGAGVASLCLAARVPSCTIVGLDAIPALVELANENAHSNGMAARLRFVCGDALAPPQALRRSYDHVFSNPPFHGDAGERSPQDDRAAALTDKGRLGEWLLSGLRRARTDGTFTAIVRADRVGEVSGVLPERGVTLFPLWPRIDQPAKRVVVQVRTGSRASLVLLPGLVLHEANGDYTDAANAVLRDGGSLALGSRRL